MGRQAAIRSGLAVAISAVLGACGGGGGTPAAPPPLADPYPLTTVSAASPLPAGCTGGGAAAGERYRGAEVEPLLAINPVDTRHRVAVWQQDRWSSGGAAGLVTAVSFDGGAAWSIQALPFSRCGGGSGAVGDYERASDPWVSFGPSGLVYQIALSFSGTVFGAGSRNALLVSRSLDGGRAWSPPQVLIADGAGFFNDKQSLTADPLDANRVYATWDRLAASGGGPAMLSLSRDQGQSWTAPQVIHDPGPQAQTLNNQIVVLPDGQLRLFFTQIEALDSPRPRAWLMLLGSADQGATWQGLTRISEILAVGARDPETGTPVRDAALLGSIAVGADGVLVVAWQDARFSAGQRDAIVLSRSADGGASWSAPEPVNGDPAVSAFLPTVWRGGDGLTAVSYYDFRANTGDPGSLPTQVWLATADEGGAWTDTALTAPFDLARAPEAGGLFVGDYQALLGQGRRLIPLFVRSRPLSAGSGDRTEVVTLELDAPLATTAKRAAVAAPELEASARQRIAERVAAQVKSRPPPYR